MTDVGIYQGSKEIFPIFGKSWKQLSDFCWKEKEWKDSKFFWKEILKLSDLENSLKDRISGEFFVIF